MTELRQELARADAMLDMKRYDQACGVLARLVAAEPENARAWCLLARAHLGAGRHQQAVDAANRAVSLDPSDEWPHRLASNALLHTDNYPEALRAGMEARRAGPRALAGPYLRGPGGAGSPAPGHRVGRGPAGPQPGPERAGRALPVGQGEPGGGRPGVGPLASGARAGAGPGPQRGHERAGPDPAAPARHPRGGPALHPGGPDLPVRKRLQPEHRRGHPADGVADDLHVHAGRAAADLDSGDRPPGPVPVRDRAERAVRDRGGQLRLDGTEIAAGGPAAGSPDAARP